MVTYVETEVGQLAINMSFPEQPRYDDGAPVVIFVSTFMTGDHGFSDNNITEGFVELSYLWPGVSHGNYSSAGEFDHGGTNCQAGLAEVARFGSGEIADIDGNYLSDYYNVIDQLGIYAFSHPGIVSINTLARYPELEVDWFVGRENPTNDEIFAVELGHVSMTKNPYYSYPEDYDPYDLGTDYSLVNYDYRQGRVYYDTNGNNTYEEQEFLFTDFGPTAWDKRYYSVDLLTVLDAKLDEWPEEVATLQEAKDFWPLRVSVHNYESLNEDLKVMLIFGNREHVQPQDDRPSIHQAYDGFTRNGNWIRLNPDSAYLPSSQDLDANNAGDWADARDWGYNSSQNTSIEGPRAGMYEMADRTYYENWDENLESELGLLTNPGIMLE